MEVRLRNHCAVEKTNKYYVFWVYVCTLSYPGYEANASYCHLRPVRLYHIFHAMSQMKPLSEINLSNTKYML